LAFSSANCDSARSRSTSWGGDSSALLGDLCLSLAGGRFLLMLVDSLLSALAELALSFALSRTLARLRSARQRQPTHNEHYHHDDHHDQYG
jgi:hypothetical protein